jgi:excisionase family DNA binding protein
MTVAEFAEAMRVRPVTVRSWISKGQLRATRGGRRKWLVRQSELTRMLEQGGSSPVVSRSAVAPSDERSSWDDYPPEVLEQMAEDAARDARAQLDQDRAESAYDWEIALEQSRMAPPDARFASRIRHIAGAAQFRAMVLGESIEDPTFDWKPIPESRGLTLSYELRPGGNRPGPKDAWDRVDRVVARLGAALEGTSATAVVHAFHDLASALNDVATAIEKGPRKRPDLEEAGPPEDAGTTE